MREETSNGIVLTVTASSVIAARNCVITSVCLNPAGAISAIQLYDPLPVIQAPGVTAAAQTTVGATLRVTLTSSALGNDSIPLAFSSGVEFANGCIAVVTGASATAGVTWATI